MSINTSGMAFPKPGDVRQTREAVTIYDDGRMVCNLKTTRGRAEYEAIKAAMWVRDGQRCCICGDPIPLAEITFQHTHGRGAGGGKRDDRPEWVDAEGKQHRNGVAHLKCNSQAGSRKVGCPCCS
jgi:hypothetical protein